MACQVCGKTVEHPVACPGCAQLLYCSHQHQVMHRNALGHAEECDRMAAQDSRRQELATHPFPWTPATHLQQPCSWLQQLGLHRCGAWLHECPCGTAQGDDWGDAAPLLRTLLARPLAHTAGTSPPAAMSREQLVQHLGDWLRLPLGQVPCLASQAPSSCASPTDWAGYYQLRGLAPESPVALLLDAALTAYATVLRLVQEASRHDQQQRVQFEQQDLLQYLQQGQQRPGVRQQQQQQQGRDQGPARELPQPLVIHWLGPQKELDQWPLLLELGCLLPRHTTIQLHLIGPEVPSWAHGTSLRVAAPSAGGCGRAGCSCARQYPPAGPMAAVLPPQGAANGQQRASSAPGSQELLFWTGQYHELTAELAERYGPPHVVVAPNAGLAAYTSWVPTLQHLAASMRQQAASPQPSCGEDTGARGPGTDTSSGTGSSTACRSGGQEQQQQGRYRAAPICCFTDYSEEAVHRAQQLCEHLLACDNEVAAADPTRQAPGGDGGGSVALESGVNPFRKPAAVLAADNRLPAASNGFGLWWL